jgi:hypothetical protein
LRTIAALSVGDVSLSALAVAGCGRDAAEPAGRRQRATMTMAKTHAASTNALAAR